MYAVWDSASSVSVSDSLGNAYVAAGNSVGWDNGAYRAQIFYTINRSSGVNTVTAIFSSSVKTFGRIYAHEYTGVRQVSPLDVTVAGAGAWGNLNSGSATTANAVDLIFAGGGSAEAVRGAGAGYTARSTAHGSITEDRVVSVAGAYNATATNRGGAWAMQMVAFAGASSGNSDSTPPSVPTGLSAADVSSSQINLSWSASTDPDNSSSQLTYGVFRNGTRIATTPAGSTAWADAGLTASTTYTYTVCAYDPAGNRSAQTAAVSAATAAGSNGSDTQPPVVSITAPGNNQTVSGVTTIAANASDNVGVAGVQFQLDGANLGAQLTSAPYSTSWNTTQTTNGSHVLTAIAVDAAGNRTVSSGVA
ncbi:MAG TPA: Ig-like domain-containing protein, partial [Bryobacteraceae bacterium]|nr:Ig-like domain-containing protein [Bryobacteraceae bacterium]